MNIFSKFNLKVVVVLTAVFAFGLVVFPRAASHTQAEACSPLYDRPIFNPYPISSQYYVGQVKNDCTDFQTLGVRNSSSNAYGYSLNAQAGDEIVVQVYVHNAGRQDLGDQTKAFNVNAYITVDGKAEQSHVIGATITGQDVNGSAISPATGSVWVYTGPNDRLEVVPGSGVIRNVSGGESSASVSGENFNVNLGDQNACFEYARFIQFKVRVVGRAQAPSGSISAQSGSKIGDQCLRDGTVTTSNIVGTNSVEVFVKDLNDNEENPFGGLFNATGQTPWLVPGHRYLYTLYNTANGIKDKLADYTLNVPDLNCAGPAAASGRITASAGNRIGDQCLRTGTVTTSNIIGTDSVEVFVKDLNDNKETPYGGLFNATGQTPWLFPGHNYLYTLYNTANGSARTSANKLSEYTLNVPGLDCATAVVSTEKNFTLTADTSMCIGQQTRFTITGTPNLVGKTIVWSSTKNGVATGENNAYNGQTVANSSGLAFWTDVGSTWQTSHIGNWTKTAVIDGISKTVSFEVRNCATPPPPAGLICTPSSQSTGPNQIVSFTASGGSGGYNWQAPNSFQTTGAGGFFSTSYPTTTSGNQTVTVTSNGQTATCNVQVASSSQVICNPLNQTVNVNQTAYFSASGGGNYSWSANGGYQTYGSGQSFSTSYSSPGNYSVIVSSNGQSASCNVQVNAVSVSNLVCNPANQSVNVNQTAYFSASGGNGNYTWYASNGSPTTGSGSSFSASFSSAGTYSATVQSNGQSQTCNITVNNINPNVGNLNINKQVKNISQGNSFGKTVNADSGNRVAYQIIITAQNNPVNNVVLSESLPSGFSYINGTLRLDSSSISDSQINSISLGNMSAGQTRTVYLEGYANSNSGQCQTVITNTASVSGAGASTVSDSATIYVNQSCGGGYSQMSITKLVRNSTGGNSYYSKNVNAQNSDRVQFEITVRNTGTQNLNNVRVRDTWNTGMSLVSGSVSVDGSYSFGNNIIDSDLFIGSLSAGQQKRITFEATVFASGGGSLQNTARASADNAGTVSDDAWVFINSSTYNPCPFGCVSGSSVNLSFQKRAINDTKNADAVSVIASREDFITYTLTVTNNGNAPANNFIVTDDLSGVLNYANITDNGGGNISGSVINFPGVTVPAYGSVSKSFKVRVKYNLPSAGSFTMNNTYGNTVSIRIGNPAQPAILGAYIAPKTGADTVGFVFSGILTAAFAIYRKRKAILSVIA